MLLKDFTYERRTAGLACHRHFLVKPHIFSCLGALIDQHFRLCQIDTILSILRMFVLSQIDDCSFLAHPLRRLLSADDLVQLLHRRPLDLRQEAL